MMRSPSLLPISLSVLVGISLFAPSHLMAANASYTYDKLNRLTTATIDGSRIEYVYDPAGNITRVLTPYSVAVTISGVGTGLVADDLGKIDCGDDCSGVYDLNTVVTLTASPAADSVFDGWTGACTGTDPCAIAVSGLLNVGAVFSQGPGAEADLWLTKEASVSATGPGGTVTYTLQIGNRGPSTAASVEVQDMLPPGSTLQSANGTNWVCSEVAGNVTCTLASLGAQTTTEIQVSVDLPSTPGVTTNTATVSAATAEAASGDESDSAAVEVFGPPTIVGVSSVALTESGQVLPGSATTSSITQLYLAASHPMNDPGGDSDPNDVTNPGCYRLFQAAPDGTFASASCADPSGLSILGATYEEAGASTIALDVSSGQSFASGQYRLVACGTGGTFLQDVYGTALDGNADGAGGDDFVLDFEVQVTNLLTNPNFDEFLGGWDVLSENPGDVTHDAATDASNALTSGSARLENLQGSDSVLEISQCVPVTGSETYLVGGRVLADNESDAVFPEVHALVVSYATTDCSGTPLNVEDIGAVIGDTGGLWERGWDANHTVPTTAASVRITYQVSGDTYAAVAWLDDLQFYFSDIIIFLDCFESGDTSKWSSTSP